MHRRRFLGLCAFVALACDKKSQPDPEPERQKTELEQWRLRREKEAAEALENAENFSDGREAVLVRSLRDVMEQYPGTAAAERARKRISKLPFVPKE